MSYEKQLSKSRKENAGETKKSKMAHGALFTVSPIFPIPALSRFFYERFLSIAIFRANKIGGVFPVDTIGGNVHLPGHPTSLSPFSR